MIHYGKFLYFAFIYLISNSKWILVKSTDTSTSKTGVDLNITSESSTNEFEYKKDGNYVTYIPKGNNAFKLVKDRKSEIWKESSASNYSLRVEVDNIFGDSKVVTVYLGDDKTKVFKKDHLSTEWEEIDLTIVIPKLINIKYESESYFYKNELNNNVRTITAKKGFSFKGAHEYVDGKKIEIWKTDKENEYSNKIEVENNKLTIYTGEGNNSKKKVLEKRTDGKWHEAGDGGTGGTQPPKTVTQHGRIGQTAGTQQQSSTPPARTGQSAGTPTVTTGQAASSQPPKTGSQESSSTPSTVPAGQSSGQNAGARTYGQPTSQPSSQASEQKPKSSPTSQSQSKSPPTTKTGTQPGSASPASTASPASPKQSAGGQSSQADQQSKKVEEGRSAGSQATSPPASPTSGTEDKAKKSTETAKRTKVEVCIKNNKKATDQFDYKKDGKTVTYTPKDNYGFKLVKQKNTEIWKAKDESEYATKVVLEGKSQKVKIITIYLLNGSTKSYKKDGKGKEWKVCVQSGTESVTKKTNKLDSDSNLVELDITNEKRTEFYDLVSQYTHYAESNSFVYTPKGNYRFKSVKHGSDVIWTSDDVEDCATKVIVTTSYRPVVIQVCIQLPSENKRFIKKGSFFSDGNWTEITNQATNKWMNIVNRVY